MALGRGSGVVEFQSIVWSRMLYMMNKYHYYYVTPWLLDGFASIISRSLHFLIIFGGSVICN